MVVGTIHSDSAADPPRETVDLFMGRDMATALILFKVLSDVEPSKYDKSCIFPGLGDAHQASKVNELQ